MAKPLFNLGNIRITPGALAALTPAGGDLAAVELLSRHVTGDWGVVDAEDRDVNQAALRDGARILSAYPIDPERPCEGYGANTIWVITEADRAATTILLPEEY